MKKVLILLGPTCVGKTGAAILLAKALDTEIISADSMQIYRGMDIGTAKPSQKEMDAVRHHMIDITVPSESYSAGHYVRAIRPILDGLLAKGKMPLIVGGTCLYIKAITRGIFSGPPADWPLREELLSLEEAGPGALYSLLLKVDEDTAVKIDRNDIRRIVRALEVCLKSREKISILRERLTEPLPYDFIKIGITRERKELYRLIEDRIDSMMAEGLVEEVERLIMGTPDRTPLQAIGYKEIASYLRGEIGLEEAVRLVKRNTRRYAKRQFAWFKREEGVRWTDVTGLYRSEEIFRAVWKALELFVENNLR